MKDVKKIGVRIIAMTVLLVVMNYVYTFFFLQHDLEKHAPMIELVRDVPTDADILYIGESSNFTYSDLDLDKRRISALLGDYYPDLKVADITKPAAHAGIYYDLLSNVPESSNIKTVVVTLNLRSFGPGWINSSLETSLLKETTMLQKWPPLLNRLRLSFKDYEIKSEKEWEELADEARINNKLTKDGLPENEFSWEWSITGTENDALARAFVKSYAFEITQDNPRVKDFDRIVELAKERNWNLVFNLMAENTEKAYKLVGQDLVGLMRDNRDTLVERYRSMGVLVVDNLERVKSEDFIDQDWTTEHYFYKGRRQIAEHVAEELRKYYKASFSRPKIQIHSGPVFLNNCDDPTVVWAQVQTLSDEESFSGNFSSKIEESTPFSVSFSHPLNQIPDSIKNEVDISVQLLNESTHVTIIFELHGDNIESKWLSNRIESRKGWHKEHWQIQNIEELRQADLIKVYVYNKQKAPAFVDDLRIEFK